MAHDEDQPLPWNGTYLFSNTDECSRADRLRQRITRAFEKAGEAGVFSTLRPYEADFIIRELADQLFARIEPFFTLPARKG